MNRLQSNPIGKVIAALLFLVFTAVFSFNATTLLVSLPYVGMNDWQNTNLFYNFLLQREDQLIQATLANTLLEDKSSNLTYVEREALEDRLERISQDMEPEHTNFRYQILSADGTTVLESNLENGTSLKSAVQTVHYRSFTADPDQYDFFMIYDGVFDEAPTPQAESAQIAPSKGDTLVIACGVPAKPAAGISDEFSDLEQSFAQSTTTINQRIQFAVLSAVLAGACLLYLLWTAGHRAGVAEIVLSWQEHIFFDLYAAVMFTAACLLAVGGIELFLFPVQLNPQYTNLYQLTGTGLLTAFVTVCALTLRTFVVRCKAHALMRTTLLCRICRWAWSWVREFGRLIATLLRSLPIIWYIIVAFAGYMILNVGLFSQAPYNAFCFLLLPILNAAVLLFLCWWAVCQRSLRKGSEAMASGNLEHQIDTRRMPYELKVTAENMNNISLGMAEAVNERMKSERFKAELITNVSHDLKTPLTSIINYVNLLKTTQQTDPKAREYIEVLDRKSLRLKKLTEDLVEASKASTGTLSIHREKIGMNQLLDQALGEWEEKLQARSLTVVTTLPEGEAWVYADGRHLWRVIDNLLSNCSKYAMEGTRIYLDLVRGHGQVVLSVKNISKQPLNIPPERLMERFVRGEESRSTEGSGLGLSIARSLTELQEGTFELVVDGDLFKAIVTLPQAN